MNVVIPAFFDKYVKERREIDVVKEAKAYPEIEIVTNLKSSFSSLVKHNPKRMK